MGEAALLDVAAEAAPAALVAVLEVDEVAALEADVTDDCVSVLP